ncbi:MAG: phosphatidylglycerol lysyltransferase domain-containing protein, partial [Candidatus Eremiobacteraeota bacterium]|nr:phosphatidylglycerol lysyltransferase domain-containing protein [Candidatus Eremiobacteraeota bacterium]
VGAVAAERADYFTLGLSPLSRRGSPPPDAGVPFWLRLTLRWVRAHGRRFYDFDGLDAFKAKFHPERWEPIYAIARGQAFPPQALYAIAGAFGGCAPAGLVAAAVARGARTEYVRWRVQRARHAGSRATAR